MILKNGFRSVKHGAIKPVSRRIYGVFVQSGEVNMKSNKCCDCGVIKGNAKDTGSFQCVACQTDYFEGFQQKYGKQGRRVISVTREKVVELLKQGKAVQEIADQLELTTASVYYHRSKAGLNGTRQVKQLVEGANEGNPQEIDYKSLYLDNQKQLNAEQDRNKKLLQEEQHLLKKIEALSEGDERWREAYENLENLRSDDGDKIKELEEKLSKESNSNADKDISRLMEESESRERAHQEQIKNYQDGAEKWRIEYLNEQYKHKALLTYLAACIGSDQGGNLSKM